MARGRLRARTLRKRGPLTNRTARYLKWAAAPAALALAAGGFVLADAHKTVALDYDGSVTNVTTWSGSVAGLLEDQDIALAEHDEVAPALDSPLEEGATVVVRVASPVELTVDGEEVTVWTTADSAAEALAELQDSGRAGSLQASSRSLTSGRDELPVIARGDVLLQADGDEVAYYVSGEYTLDELLEVFGVTLGELDTVDVTASGSADAVVTITRISEEERTTTEEIAFETTTRSTDELYTDQSRVVQEGQAGERTIVTFVRTVDGQEVETQELSNEVTREPVTKIVEQGTKERPATTTSSSTSSSSSTTSSVSGDVWTALAQCESGGNPTTNTGNGYYGLYQFSLSTWQAVGGSGLPSEASAAEQTQRAQILQARSGWGQWPACARQLGLL